MKKKQAPISMLNAKEMKKLLIASVTTQISFQTTFNFMGSYCCIVLAYLSLDALLWKLGNKLL